jgi:hypothetical protein
MNFMLGWKPHIMNQEIHLKKFIPGFQVFIVNIGSLGAYWQQMMKNTTINEFVGGIHHEFLSN